MVQDVCTGHRLLWLVSARDEATMASAAVSRGHHGLASAACRLVYAFDVSFAEDPLRLLPVRVWHQAPPSHRPGVAASPQLRPQFLFSSRFVRCQTLFRFFLVFLSSFLPALRVAFALVPLPKFPARNLLTRWSLVTTPPLCLSL